MRDIMVAKSIIYTHRTYGHLLYTVFAISNLTKLDAIRQDAPYLVC